MATASALEKYVALAKGTKGIGVVGVLQRALAAKDVFVFGELLALPNVQELAATAEHKPHLDLVNLFAYGTYSDYKAAPAAYPALNDALLTKLKQLSLVSLCTAQKDIAYADLMAVLDLPDVRALEDLMIASLYAGLIKGKLDQRAGTLEVYSTMGRDVRTDAASLTSLGDRLRAWRAVCAVSLDALATQVQAASDAQTAEARRQAAYAGRVEDARKAASNELNVASGAGGGHRGMGGMGVGDGSYHGDMGALAFMMGPGGTGGGAGTASASGSGGVAGGMLGVAMDIDDDGDDRRRTGKRRMHAAGRETPGRR